MSVTKDLADRKTDIILLYSEPSYRSKECFRLFYFCKNTKYVVRLFFFPSASFQI